MALRLPISTILRASVFTAAPSRNETHSLRAELCALHHRPQAHGVGFVNEDISTRSSGLTVLVLTYLGELTVPNCDTLGTDPDDRIFEEFMQTFLFSLTRVKCVFLCRLFKRWSSPGTLMLSLNISLIGR